MDEHNRHYSSDNRGVLFDKEKSLLLFAPGAITDFYKIPEGVTGIGEHAFFFCHYLTAISIPDSVAIIGDNAIYSCGSLNKICVDENNRYFSSDNRGVLLNKEKSLLLFAPGAITGSYQIPNGVTSIGDYAFNCCSNLTGIIIPEGVTSIGISSFSNCQCLTAIDIPNSVTAIGDNAFSFCSNLSTIRFAGNAPEFGDSVFSDVTATACYPADNPTWTNDVMQNYNGTINWIPWDSTHTHDYSSIVTTPTCTEQGYTTYTCDCGDRYVSDHVDALGHDMGKWQTVIAPTCTEQGFTTYTCGCGDSYVSDHVDALGHDYNGGICTRCGEADPDYQPPEEPPFTDVPTGSFYEEPVLWAVGNGITTGATDETFNPNGQCMRAQVVTFLWRTAGCPEPNTSNNPFVDVNPSDYYYKAVLWAVENGITNGADATHFTPFGICNRAQVVTFLYRAQTDPQAGDTQGSFSDVADDAWYSAPIEWAASNEITNGLGDGTFGINTSHNRAQVVTFLYRAYT